MIPGWEGVISESHIQVDQITGSYTNSVFCVKKNLRDEKPQKVLLRVYGNGVDQLINREGELQILRMLSSVNIGPQLLGIFKNGRFEQFLDSKPLTKDDLCMAPVSRHIACRMFQLHNIVNTFPPKKDVIPEVWVNIDRWYPLACKAVESDNKEALRLLNLLKDEIPRLKSILSKVNSPIVFAHNDTQYGNILRLADESNQLVVVDFEYAGYNYRGFDIGNHFCEWSYDYNGPEPHVFHRDWFPTEDKQYNFLSAYLEAQDQELGLVTTRDQLTLQRMRVECNAFSLASHVLWGVWGIIQAAQSEISFDYRSYGIQRLQAFEDFKEGIYNQILEYF
ncbi:1994_t:CDS:2 [Acaulospora morrowiae]|uniref:1994_t:CDS:1 n=1 Tax=Acaulospora morrowiae TaxID=94023 RepID=A0A9N9H2B7_9GLOM|nr:1994_t:CDS:2 [Acaulospora morrowiae]